MGLEGPLLPWSESGDRLGIACLLNPSRCEKGSRFKQRAEPSLATATPENDTPLLPALRGCGSTSVTTWCILLEALSLGICRSGKRATRTSTMRLLECLGRGLDDKLNTRRCSRFLLAFQLAKPGVNSGIWWITNGVIMQYAPR